MCSRKKKKKKKKGQYTTESKCYQVAERDQAESITANRNRPLIFWFPVMHKLLFFHCTLRKNRNSSEKEFAFPPSPNINIEASN